MLDITSTEACESKGIIIVPYASFYLILEFRKSKRWYFQNTVALRVQNVKQIMKKYALERLLVIYT